MKAITFDRYGAPDVLRMSEVATPVPQDNEVRVRIHATSVTSGDLRVRGLRLPRGFGMLGRLALGVAKPRQPILGTELSGVVDAVGRSVTRFKVGDEVFAFPGARMRSYAEYRCLAQDDAIVPKPANLSHEEAATISFGGMTMLDFYRRGMLRDGEHVLVNGSSGGVGIAAVQLAKHFGARVTAVCSSGNEALVRSYGADAVIDYTCEDFTANGGRYDVIVDTAGTAPFSRSRRALKPRGRLLQVLGDLADLLMAPVASIASPYRVVAGPAAEKPADLATLAALAAAGKFRAAIDRQYSLSHVVEAHRYVELGRKKGSVVLVV